MTGDEAHFFGLQFETVIVSLMGISVAGFATLLGLYFIKQGRKSYESTLAANESPENSVVRVERRRFPRVHGGLLAVTLVPIDDKLDPMNARIIDRSLGGVGLEVDRELPVGMQLLLRLNAANIDAAEIKVETRYSRKRDNAWRVGCKFVDTSPWEIMRLFGPPEPEQSSPSESDQPSHSG